MPNLSREEQSKTDAASCEGVCSGNPATEKDITDITAVTVDACDGALYPAEDTTMRVTAKRKGRSLLISALTIALLLLLPCRLLFSILTATLSLFRQQQVNDNPPNQVVSVHTIDINLQHGSEANHTDEAHLAKQNTGSSLQEALTSAQVTFDQFLASQRDADLDSCIENWKNVLAICPIDHEIRPSILKNLGKSLRAQFDRSSDRSDLEESICHQRAAILLWPTGHPIRPPSLRNLGNALRMRFNKRGEMADLDESICHYQEALFLQPVDHADRPTFLDSLSNILRIRFDRMGEKADLEESARLRQEALSLLTMDHVDEPRSLSQINRELAPKQPSDKDTVSIAEAKLNGEGVSSSSGTETTARGQQKTADVNTASRQRRRETNANDGMNPDSDASDPIRTHCLALLASRVAAERFVVSDRDEDLDASIKSFNNVLEVFPKNHPGYLEILRLLVMALDMQVDRSGEMVNLEECIHNQQGFLFLCPIDHPDRTSTLNSLGNRLQTRFRRTEKMADLEDSIRHLQEALTLRPTGHPDRASTLSSLGIGLNLRFNQTRNMGDLEESIRRLQEALTLRPIGHPRRISTLRNLDVVWHTRFDRAGDMTDLEESIRHLQEALTLCPIGHPDRASALRSLGNRLQTRFKGTRNMTDLGESIRHLQEALTLHPIGHLDRVSNLITLAIGLHARFDLTGNVADLEESNLHFQEALTLHPTGHPERASTLSNLGVGLNTCFDWTGNMGDLEESIRYHREALALCPAGHRERASILNNLGSSLDKRFEWTENVADLEESIGHHQEALTLRPIGDPDRPITLNNLANMLDTRFKRTGSMAELDESICYRQEGLTLHPTDHPGREAILNNFGNSLRARFDRTENMADLEESIRHHQEALTLNPIGHPGRALALNNLALCLNTQFRRTGSIADLEESIRHHQEALTLRPISNPDRATTLANLGAVLCGRFERTGDTADLKESIQCFMAAAGHALSNLASRLLGAVNWITAARQYGHESLAEAYSTYMDLLDRSLLLPASNIPDTHSHMVQIRGGRVNMTEDATSHAIKKHRLCEAVEIAERGRALLFTQLGNYRTPLDDLEIANKDLADRFRALSTVLDHSATSLPDTKTTLPVSGDPVARRQQMAADWDRTVNEIRQLDGFVGFLGATPFATLQKAAENGPVIIVNISRDGSDALIITTSEDPISVPLPDATPSAIRALANTLIVCTRSQADQPKSDQRLTEVLRELWAMVVAPVVLQLENTLDLPVGLRIWWMPTSFAWWLPLHAAGPYKSGKRNLPDRFVSSYTTTLSSLIRARAGYQPVKHVLGPRVLVIAQAEAEGQDQLPNVKVEVALIRQLGTNVMVIEEEDCTKDAVLAGLRDMAWVHFSCHGHQLEQPFKSHFSLRAADAPLTLLDIIQNDLPQAELAVLSACHSASGDPSALNEVVNLAAGIMFAGFRSAVGTMWAMADKDGPVMADHFYKYMFRNGPEAVDCRDAAKAMVMGVRELRRREVPLARWVNFVHYGI